MSFSKFLKDNVDKSKKTRASIIAKLNLFDHEFRELDTVTFSRWMTGKTTPSLYKQIMICLFFKHDLYHFIRERKYTINSTMKILEKRIKRDFCNMECSNLNLSYNYNKNNNPDFFVTFNSYEQYKKKFDIFYSHFDLYQNIKKQIQDKKIQPIFIGLEKYIDDTIVSHDLLTYIDDSMKNIIENIFGIDIDISDFWLSNIGYYISENSYKTAFRLGLYFLIRIKKYDYLSIIRGSNTLNNLTEMGYNQITNSIIDNKEKVYLCQANVLRVISNPLVLSSLSDFFRREDKIDSYFDSDIINKYF